MAANYSIATLTGVEVKLYKTSIVYGCFNLYRPNGEGYSLDDANVIGKIIDDVHTDAFQNGRYTKLKEIQEILGIKTQ